MTALAKAIPAAPQPEKSRPDRAANDNRPVNPTIVDLPPPTAAQRDRVLDALTDLLAARVLQDLGIGPANDGLPE